MSETNARQRGVEGQWSQGNEQWWDWYMSLAVNEAPVRALRPAPRLPPDVELPLALAEAELEQEFTVSETAKEAFRLDGYVAIHSAVSVPALMGLRQAFRALFDGASLPAMGFPSLEMMWTYDAWCRAFVLSRRLASIAGQLLDVQAVRLYHDNALIKSPGCGRTPWHYDAHHYPIASSQVVTAWLPLQPTPLAMGPLSFARGMDVYERVRDLDFDKFGTAYDATVMRILSEAGVPVETVEYDLGTVTFHHAHSLHSAAPNQTDGDRMALATTYFEDGARLVDRPTLISGDFQKFMPGIGPGDIIASELNPVVWSCGGEE